MAVHRLFQGGKPSYKSGYQRRQFPATRMGNYEDWAVDFRKMNSHFSNSRLIDLSCSQGCVDCGDQAGSIELRSYFEENEVVAGDVIEIIGLSKFSLMHGLWWNVEGAVPGLTFTMDVQGLAGSSVPAPVSLGALNAGVVASGYVPAPLYFDHNDMVRLTVTAVPAPDPDAACSSCANTPLSGLKLWLAVVGNELCRGDVGS